MTQDTATTRPIARLRRVAGGAGSPRAAFLFWFLITAGVVGTAQLTQAIMTGDISGLLNVGVDYPARELIETHLPGVPLAEPRWA